MFLCSLVPWLSVTFRKKITEIFPGEPLRREGVLKQRAVAKYSDYGPFQGYISETVQDRR